MELDPGDERAILPAFVSKLDGCDSSALRAQCGLVMMMEQSRARGGLLYACRAETVKRIAMAGIAEPSEALDAWATAYLDDQLDRDGTTEVEHLGATSSTDTPATVNGSEIKPVLLMHQTARGLVIAGVALLLVEPCTEYRHPTYLAGELSRYLVEHGDAAPLES